MKSSQPAVPKGIDLLLTSLCIQLGSILVGIAMGLLLHLLAPDFARRDISPDVEVPGSIAIMVSLISVVCLLGLLIEVVGKVQCFSSPRQAGGKVPLAFSLATSALAVVIVPLTILRLTTAQPGLPTTVAGAMGVGVVFVGALFFCWYARSLAHYFRPELTGRATIAIVLFGFALACMIATVVSEVQAKVAASRPRMRVETEPPHPVSSEGMDEPQFPPPPPPQPGLLNQLGNTWMGAGGIGMLLYMWLLRDLRGAKRKAGGK